MKRQKENPGQVVDRFLGRMGEPVSEEQSDRATSDVLERLRAGNVSGFRVAAMPQVRSAPLRVWSAIAAVAAVMLAGGLLQITLVQFAAPDVVARSARGELQIGGRVGAFPFSPRIHAGNVVKSGSGGGAIALLDGSQIDMGPGTELSVVRSADGLRVRLTSGTVLVTAAKQRGGHLYVETKDCLVSVVGTVFAVNAEESGSRISVLEGEVHVQRGDLSQTLLAGQQASTSPQLGPFPPDTGNGWVAPERLALLQPQPAPPAPQNPVANTGVAVRGIVKQASTGAGISDVTVVLCPAPQGKAVAFAPVTNEKGVPPVNANEANAGGPGVGNKTFNFALGVPIDRNEANAGGPIVRNKTFFFALWDAAATRCNTAGVTTDSAGRFQFSNVVAGDYVVNAEKEGYSGIASNSSSTETRAGFFRYFFNAWTPKGGEARVEPSVLPGDSKSVTVEAQQAPQELSLTLTRAGVLSGRVRDAEGRLLVNAQVRVLGVPSQGANLEGPAVAVARTNDLGEYRAYWLLPGEYRVVATGPAGRPFAETWFPRDAASTEAVTVTVREGEEVQNIDIVLRPGQPDAPQANPGVRWVPR